VTAKGWIFFVAVLAEPGSPIVGKKLTAADTVRPGTRSQGIETDSTNNRFPWRIEKFSADLAKRREK